MGWPKPLKPLIRQTNKTVHNSINKPFIKISGIFSRLPVNNRSKIIFLSLF